MPRIMCGNADGHLECVTIWMSFYNITLLFTKNKIVKRGTRDVQNCEQDMILYRAKDVELRSFPTFIVSDIR